MISKRSYGILVAETMTKSDITVSMIEHAHGGSGEWQELEHLVNGEVL
jgi:hypothetical protein